MVKLEGEMSGATAEDEAVEVNDRIVKAIILAAMPQNEQGDEEEGCVYS